MQEGRKTGISRHGIKASNDVGESLASGSPVKFMGSLVSIKSRHASYLHLVSQLTNSHSGSHVFSKWHLLKLPLKWSDSHEGAGAAGHVTQGCPVPPTLVFPRWGSVHDHTACRGRAALTAVLLVDCHGIVGCLGLDRCGFSSLLPWACIFQRWVGCLRHLGLAVAVSKQSIPVLLWKYLQCTGREKKQSNAGWNGERSVMSSQATLGR